MFFSSGTVVPPLVTSTIRRLAPPPVECLCTNASTWLRTPVHDGGTCRESRGCDARACWCSSATCIEHSHGAGGLGGQRAWNTGLVVNQTAGEEAVAADAIRSKIAGRINCF